ncbi:hypothetical protein CC78DRAFT_536791 [Lojkania enalia]|uniref:Uncharacterized protein n=1 Tax=Lojkania enalia TaxID=147567 RepID=A0A9P4JZ40_9PLEO|nr:hypothetical protein CC78DRAFT_536791 [Didymosphaeria enalia]
MHLPAPWGGGSPVCLVPRASQPSLLLCTAPVVLPLPLAGSCRSLELPEHFTTSRHSSPVGPHTLDGGGAVNLEITVHRGPCSVIASQDIQLIDRESGFTAHRPAASRTLILTPKAGIQATVRVPLSSSDMQRP